ncbi:uncharacterized protein LOC112577088 isoform X2 [Pomacea canaliculata]|uniref:uncharacterized protein LOC112577088 isoform X2 n=1 Tax=Pomacea canaliculata TaxID=400727 RepID=UPI000D7286EE|nr:uncharacterized protein LOC112577088 isoform X2 [Pomacea canaliculata]
MAMSYHMEARIKQERLDRWNRIKQMPLSDESKELSNTPEKFVPGLIEPRCTDSGQFDMRSVHNWMGYERNRRHYDHSREGPLLESTWRNLRRELNVREKVFSTGLPGTTNKSIGLGLFFPVDTALSK